ncbi:MAG: RluA family pseudouridine synthase [Sedimentisphaerales bacterium]|nr:RluA family pseudouridine synthase [Sedimentisphaerales bacterium]
MTPMPKKKRLANKLLPKGLEILYEDKDLLVVDKPAGLLTVATATNKTQTACYFLADYVRKGNPKSRSRVFTVHRLDQWTSGVIVFAKSEEIKLRLQARWKETEKKYLAVVHGRLHKKQGVISSYLAENKAFVVYSTTDPAKGKLARTAYKVIKETPRFSLLELTLLTGRKNQIRVHLADVGHPVVGDRKYGTSQREGTSRGDGTSGDNFRRLALHAKSISFEHPSTGEHLTFESLPPDYFRWLLSKNPG